MSQSAAASRPVALAIAAHPDDIEFCMAGTMLRLRDAGCEIHFCNLSSGHCGTMEEDAATIAGRRWEEAQAAAAIAGATIHPPITHDMAIFYNERQLRQVAALVRKVRPGIVLTHAPADYMEDHMNTSRLAVTAAFCRGMPNYLTDPMLPPVTGDCVVYHAMPHGLRDPLRRRVRAELYVHIADQMATKKAMLAAHVSQKAWLDASQGMDSYLSAMAELNREVGRLAGVFDYAEGWRRHQHYGFGPEHFDPLRDLLGDACWVDPAYVADLG